MSGLKRVSDYSFLYPCKVCREPIQLRRLQQHFQKVHSNIDIRATCFLCLGNGLSEMREHRKICAAAIAQSRKRTIPPPVVLESIKCYNTSRTNWYKKYANVVTPVPEGSLVHRFDDLPPYPSYYRSTDDSRISLKLPCMERNRGAVAPLVLDQTHFHAFVQWILHRESNIYDEPAKQVVRCLLEYKDNEWYHLIVSRYHFDSFLSLSSGAGYAPFRCLCRAKADETDRTVHVHLLARIEDFGHFKSVCWSKLRSPDSQRYKMCVLVKSFHHLFNVVFYLSQQRPCSGKEGSKHYDIAVHLSDKHEDLIQLVFRKIFYDHKIQPLRNRISMLNFTVCTMNDRQSDKHYVSHAENVVESFDRVLFHTARLVHTRVPDADAITFGRNGILSLQQQQSEDDIFEDRQVTVRDVIREADGLDYWIVWEKKKVSIINDLVITNGVPNTVAVRIVEGETAEFFGDGMCGIFTLEERTVARNIFDRANIRDVIVANVAQFELATEFIGRSNFNPILSREKGELSAKQLYKTVGARLVLTENV